VGCGGPVIAYRASDGQELWRTSLPSGSSAPAVGQGDTVYVATYSNIVALSAKTGAVRWSRAQQSPYDGIASNMVWANGILFVLTRKGLATTFELRALDARTGRSLARFAVRPDEFNQLYVTALTVVDGRVHIGFWYGGRSNVLSFHTTLGFAP
jgi:outer membrane protein assembly factor BamB